MKKTVSVLLALLLLFSTACFVSADEAVELRIYYPASAGDGSYQLMQELCGQFHAEHPGILVTLINTGSYADTFDRIVKDLQAGGAPAVSLVRPGDLRQLHAMNALQDYDRFCAAEGDRIWLNGFYDCFMQDSRLTDASGGRLTYGIPWQRSTVILYWNKDAFREAGLDPDVPPATWAELEAFALRLVGKNQAGSVTRYGIGIPADKADVACRMLQAFTLTQDRFSLASDDGAEVYFSHPAAVAGLTFWKHLRDIGAMSASGRRFNARSDFENGAIAMMYNSADLLPGIKKNVSFEFGTACLPAGAVCASPAGGGSFCLFKGADIADDTAQAAFDFVRWLTGDIERVAQWSIDTGSAAVRPEAYDTRRMIEYAAGFPGVLTVRSQLEHACAELSVYDGDIVQNILYTAIEEVMTGLKNPEAALNTAQLKADAILEAYR